MLEQIWSSFLVRVCEKQIGVISMQRSSANISFSEFMHTFHVGVKMKEIGTTYVGSPLHDIYIDPPSLCQYM